MEHSAEIGIFGGSGFYSFLENTETVKVETPYGAPSGMVTLGEIGGRKVAFLPRHGAHHDLPPHMVNFRANVYAMKSLGVTQIIGPCAAGSLQAHVKPGEFVICDQFVDRTRGRKDTFYDGPMATHVAMAHPYCETLRPIAAESARTKGVTVHDKGTVVVVQGPRFSTKAESKWFSDQGWEVINMTQYPEAYLARELEMCYVNISLITDHDVGLEGHPDVKEVTADDVMKIFGENISKLREVLFDLVPKMPTERTCECATALKFARF